MDEELDTKIEIVFQSDGGVPAEVVTWVISRVASAIHDAELDELDEMLEFFPEWPAVARDAIRYRFDQVVTGRVLNIEYGGRGSLLLFGTAAGLAYWIADKTLGETVKQAWVESDSHGRLKSFLRLRVFAKREKIKEALGGSWHRGQGVEEVLTSIEDGRAPTIRIEVRTIPNSVIPAPSQVADRNRRRAADGEAAG